MQFNVYCIRDVVLKESGPLFCEKNDGVALRSFNEFLLTRKNPEDYKLYYLGMYNYSDTLLVHDTPREVVPTVEDVRDASK